MNDWASVWNGWYFSEGSIYCWQVFFSKGSFFECDWRSRIWCISSKNAAFRRLFQDPEIFETLANNKIQFDELFWKDPVNNKKNPPINIALSTICSLKNKKKLKKKLTPFLSNWWKCKRVKPLQFSYQFNISSLHRSFNR